MRTSEEIAGEVWRRVEIRARREEATRKKARIFALAAACFGIVAALAFVIPAAMQDTLLDNAFLYSAVVFSEGPVGEYVLIAVVSFALGTAFTLFCVRKAGKK